MIWTALSSENQKPPPQKLPFACLNPLSSTGAVTTLSYFGQLWSVTARISLILGKRAVIDRAYKHYLDRLLSRALQRAGSIRSTVPSASVPPDRFSVAT